MLVFPQLTTGASALYPVTKTCDAADGGEYAGRREHGGVMPIRMRRRLAWEMQATGLTLAEWNAIEALFEATSGMWQTFTFLDPAGNLLAHSENFGAGAWTNGALIELTAGIGDPLGTTRATRVVNAGEAAEAVTQTLACRGIFNIA